MRYLCLLFVYSAVALQAAVVRIEFTAQISTVAQSPFGLDGSARTQMVSGYFQYDTSTPDQGSSAGRGDYLHERNGAFRIELPSDIVVTGSATPQLQIEDLGSDTFRFQDGLSVFEPTVGAMSVNGVADEELNLTIAITDSSGNAVNSTAAPVAFSFTPAMPHTFSLSHDAGTLLMQFVTLTVPGGPEVAVGGVVDAASFQAKHAPGALASLFGQRLAFVVSEATELPLPTDLDGVSVQVDGIPAGLIFAAPGTDQFSDSLRSHHRRRYRHAQRSRERRRDHSGRAQRACRLRQPQRWPSHRP